MVGHQQLPPSVQSLLVDQAHKAALSEEVKASQEKLTALWAEHADRVHREAPYAMVEEGGETIYMRELSPGCQACKAGRWDCLFLTQRCNLSCSFCCSPSLRKERVPLSAFGRDVEEIIANYGLVQPQGISFSGGEVFLEFDRLLQMARVFRTAFPAAYLWVYTNGSLVTAEQLAGLGRLGIDEIRFNLAATGYTNAGILQVVGQACRSIPNVAVEIPAIPDDSEKLLAAVETWSRLGVRFLNLHELMYEPGSLSARLPGPRISLHTPDGHFTEIDPRSRELTMRVMQIVHEHGLPLAVNDCSMQNKLRQVRGRRVLMGRLVERLPGSTEILDEEGYLQTICAFGPAGKPDFLHPDAYSLQQNKRPAARKQPASIRYLRLRRLSPLSIYEKYNWELVEELD